MSPNPPEADRPAFEQSNEKGARDAKEFGGLLGGKLGGVGNDGDGVPLGILTSLGLEFGSGSGSRSRSGPGNRLAIGLQFLMIEPELVQPFHRTPLALDRSRGLAGPRGIKPGVAGPRGVKPGIGLFDDRSSSWRPSLRALG
jgi:hypothetical protein